MAERLFDIIFDGSIANGFDEATVRSNLAQLFKLDAAGVDKLFTGKAVSLKRGIDRTTAAKYQAALTKAGARIQLRMQQASDTSEPSKTKYAETPDGAWDILPAGSDLLKKDERRQIPDAKVDTSHIKLESVNPFSIDDEPLPSETTKTDIDAPNYEVAAAGSDLLAEKPKMSTPPPPDVSMISVAEVGETLSNEDDHEIEVLDLPDIDDWSIAPTGSDLLDEKPAATNPPNPDISHLHVLDD